ncbi:MAG: hypothetical protein F6K17_40535 [Okeania sp. SIO3C4]|nr:hypothetical protein [Okeania sp. SIO3C4]
MFDWPKWLRKIDPDAYNSRAAKPITGQTFITDVNLKKLPAHKYAKLLSLVLTDKIDAASLTVHDIVSIGRYPYLNYFAKLNKADKDLIIEII